MKPFLFVLLMIASGEILCQISVAPSGILQRKEVTHIIEQLGTTLTDVYFNPTKGRELNRLLKQRLKQGEFYDITADTLCIKLTNFLRRETHDIHFYVGHKKQFTQPNRHNRNLISTVDLLRSLWTKKFVLRTTLPHEELQTVAMNNFRRLLLLSLLFLKTKEGKSIDARRVVPDIELYSSDWIKWNALDYCILPSRTISFL